MQYMIFQYVNWILISFKDKLEKRLFTKLKEFLKIDCKSKPDLNMTIPLFKQINKFSKKRKRF